MTTLNHTARRLISVAAAAGTTLALFSGVVSISEPQRSALMARQQAVPAVETRVAVASAVADTDRH